MKVQVLRAMDRPEQLVCQAARGDYYDGYVGDTDYEVLMEPVDYDEQDVEAVEDYISQNGAQWIDEHMAGPVETAASTRSFIHKQLSRGHYGPWEHPQIIFSVEGVSRVLMAQITRHRHMSFDVQSMRYVDFDHKNAVVPPTLLTREERLERYPHVYDEDGAHFQRHEGRFEMDEEQVKHWRASYKSYVSEVVDFYQDMVDDGIPKEDARFVLPLGTPVNMTFSGNARTFLHLLDMRRKQNAQWEIRELSERLIRKLKDWMPYSFNYYDNYGPNKLSP